MLAIHSNKERPIPNTSLSEMTAKDIFSIFPAKKIKKYTVLNYKCIIYVDVQIDCLCPILWIFGRNNYDYALYADYVKFRRNPSLRVIDISA